MDDMEVRPSGIHGRGLFARRALRGRQKLGELTGEIISVREARRRAKAQHCIAIVEFEDDKALDATNDERFRFVNHSCEPNTYMRRANHRVEFYSLRAIRAGEELTCDYGDTHHEGALPCACGSARCRTRL